MIKISEFTDDQSDQVIALWEKCGLTVVGIIQKKILPQKW
jgi:hypothetical protein